MCRHLGHFIKECVFPDNKPEDIAREIVYAITHEKEEISAHWKSFMEQLPEYAYLCEELLSESGS